MKIDKINIAIIKHLRDGRKSFKEIADSLNLSENTVRSRVNKLTENGVFEVCDFRILKNYPVIARSSSVLSSNLWT